MVCFGRTVRFRWPPGTKGPIYFHSAAVISCHDASSIVQCSRPATAADWWTDQDPEGSFEYFPSPSPVSSSFVWFRSFRPNWLLSHWGPMSHSANLAPGPSRLYYRVFTSFISPQSTRVVMFRQVHRSSDVILFFFWVAAYHVATVVVWPFSRVFSQSCVNYREPKRQ